MTEDIRIQWYPGHMTRARRKMEDALKMVDAVCELTDARIPLSSRNPDIDELAAGKPRMMILNRADLADPAVTKLWTQYFLGQGLTVLETDSKSGRGLRAFPGAVRTLLADKLAAYAAKGQTGRRLRVMVAGIPNVGKSTFINKVAGRKAAEASDRPGVTRANQWVAVDETLELLDTPGILWPKFDSREVGVRLACTGAVRDEILDQTALAAALMTRLRALYPGALTARYKIEPDGDADGYTLLEAAARRRGFLISGGAYDLDRMAAVLLDEFRGGKLGRISLEKPGEA